MLVAQIGRKDSYHNRRRRRHRRGNCSALRGPRRQGDHRRRGRRPGKLDRQLVAESGDVRPLRRQLGGGNRSSNKLDSIQIRKARHPLQQRRHPRRPVQPQDHPRLRPQRVRPDHDRQRQGHRARDEARRPRHDPLRRRVHNLDGQRGGGDGRTGPAFLHGVQARHCWADEECGVRAGALWDSGELHIAFRSGHQNVGGSVAGGGGERRSNGGGGGEDGGIREVFGKLEGGDAEG